MNNLIGLEIGQKLKIKDIGILLGKDIPEKLQTNTKKSWLREFDTYCKYHKEKVSYVIDEIYESQIEKVDGRGKHNNHKGTEGNNDKFKKYNRGELFNCSENVARNNYGIYAIVDDNKNIYVGSTTDTFYNRYKQHINKNNTCGSKDIVCNNHMVNVLFDMTDIEDDELIRIIEEEFITYFESNEDFNSKNKKLAIAKYSTNKKKKEVWKRLYINEEYLETVKTLLNENGVSYKTKK